MKTLRLDQFLAIRTARDANGASDLEPGGLLGVVRGLVQRQAPAIGTDGAGDANDPPPIAADRPRHKDRIAWVLAGVALVYFMPLWFVPSVIGLLLLIYVLVGAERVRHVVFRMFCKFRDQLPRQAETLRQLAAAVTAGMANLADRLPEGWTQGLYFPDFDLDETRHQKLDVDPFDRLSREAQLH